MYFECFPWDNQPLGACRIHVSGWQKLDGKFAFNPGNILELLDTDVHKQYILSYSNKQANKEYNEECRT